MPTTQTNGTKTLDFAPVEYDNAILEPDAPEGEWRADVKCKLIADKNKNPLIILEFTLKEGQEGNENFLGKRVSDFLGFTPKTAPNSNMNKLRARKICEKLDIPLDTIPSGTITSREQIQPFMDAIEEAGQGVQIWTVHKTADSGEVRVNIAYTEPGGYGGSSAEEEEKPAPKKTPAKGGKTAVAAKGRR